MFAQRIISERGSSFRSNPVITPDNPTVNRSDDTWATALEQELIGRSMCEPSLNILLSPEEQTEIAAIHQAFRKSASPAKIYSHHIKFFNRHGIDLATLKKIRAYFREHVNEERQAAINYQRVLPQGWQWGWRERPGVYAKDRWGSWEFHLAAQALAWLNQESEIDLARKHIHLGYDVDMVEPLGRLDQWIESGKIADQFFTDPRFLLAGVSTFFAPMVQEGPLTHVDGSMVKDYSGMRDLLESAATSRALAQFFWAGDVASEGKTVEFMRLALCAGSRIRTYTTHFRERARMLRFMEKLGGSKLGLEVDYLPTRPQDLIWDEITGLKPTERLERTRARWSHFRQNFPIETFIVGSELQLEAVLEPEPEVSIAHENHTLWSAIEQELSKEGKGRAYAKLFDRSSSRTVQIYVNTKGSFSFNDMLRANLGRFEGIPTVVWMPLGVDPRLNAKIRELLDTLMNKHPQGRIAVGADDFDMVGRHFTHDRAVAEQCIKGELSGKIQYIVKPGESEGFETLHRCPHCHSIMRRVFKRDDVELQGITSDQVRLHDDLFIERLKHLHTAWNHASGKRKDYYKQELDLIQRQLVLNYEAVFKHVGRERWLPLLRRINQEIAGFIPEGIF